MLDCVSVFALTCADTMAAFELMRGSDDVNPFMRPNAHGPLPALNGRQVRFGIPMVKQRVFFDDALARQQYESAIDGLRDIGELCEIDFSPFQEAGELMFKALGSPSASSRSPLAPDVPTIAESGYPGFRAENMTVMLAPAGLPEPIAALLEREVQAALKHPDIVERLRAMDTTPAGIVGPELRARLRADREAWAKVVTAAGMSLD